MLQPVVAYMYHQRTILQNVAARYTPIVQLDVLVCMNQMLKGCDKELLLYKMANKVVLRNAWQQFSYRLVSARAC